MLLLRPVVIRVQIIAVHLARHIHLGHGNSWLPLLDRVNYHVAGLKLQGGIVLLENQLPQGRAEIGQEYPLPRVGQQKYEQVRLHLIDSRLDVQQSSRMGGYGVRRSHKDHQAPPPPPPPFPPPLPPLPLPQEQNGSSINMLAGSASWEAVA